MAKAVVSESALRELLREALENSGAMGHDARPPVTPNPAMDRASLELDLDPIEVRHVPRSKNELIVMVRNLLDTVDDDQSGELYKGIKRLVGGDDTGKKDFAKATELPPSSATASTPDRSNDMDKKNNVGENKLVDAIRSIVKEALDEAPITVAPQADAGAPVTAVLPAATEEEEAEPQDLSELGEAIRHIADEALAEAKKKGLPDSFKKNIFKKKGKKVDEADKLPTKGKTKHKTTDFGGGELAEAIRHIAAEALAEASMGAPAATAPLPAASAPPVDEMDELDEANYDEAMAEAEGEHKLPFGFGKGRFTGAGGFDTSRPGDEDDLEGPPSKTFRAMGGETADEFGGPKGSTPLWDPNEDIIFDDEREAALAALTKSAWDPEDDADDEAPAAPAGKKSPKPRIDAGTGYGVDGDTFEKIGEKLGFTPEAAKKAVAVAQERFKVLHGMDPDDLAELVMTGVDEYIAMLAKTGELDDADVKYLHDNADQVEESEEFRNFFSKFVKRAVRDERADTQDDGDDDN